MSTLPRSLAVVRNGVANILLSSDHSGRLYSADDIAGALNNGAAVDESPSITARISVTTLLRAFANCAADSYALSYDESFHRAGDTSVLYVRKEIKRGRRTADSRSLFIGRFESMEAGQNAKVVRWRVAMDSDVRAGLIRYLSKGKKRRSSEVSPDNVGGSSETETSRPPLVPVATAPNKPVAADVLHYHLGGGGQGDVPSHPTA